MSALVIPFDDINDDPTSPLSPMESLPPELLLQILSYLPAPSLVLVPRLSKTLRSFFNADKNESVVWRNAAVLHGLIGFSRPQDGSGIGSEPPRREWGRWLEWAAKSDGQRRGATDVKWSDVVGLYSDQSLSGLGGNVDWKSFFKRRLEIHRSWCGQLPSSIVRYSSEAATFSRYSASHMATLQRAVNMAKKLQLEEQTKPQPPQRRSPSPHEEDEAEFYLQGDPGEDDDNGQLDAQVRAAKRAFGISPEFPLRKEEKLALLNNGPLIAERIRTPFLEVVEHFLPVSKNVHRIKVDERNGFVITTSREGGLVVSDITDKSMLWCLPRTYVRASAHLEYEQGYMIFDRPDGSKEVWRSSSLAPHDDPVLKPDRRQRLAAALANGDNDDLLRADVRARRPGIQIPPSHLDEGQIGVTHILDIAASFLGGPGTQAYQKLVGFMDMASPLLDGWARGEMVGSDDEDAPGPSGGEGTRRLSPIFVPHMVIPVPMMQDPGAGEGVLVPDPTRAYRFVYPNLLASSLNRAYIWDLRTGDQVQIVDAIQTVRVPEDSAKSQGECDEAHATPAGVVGVLGVHADMPASPIVRAILDGYSGLPVRTEPDVEIAEPSTSTPNDKGKAKHNAEDEPIEEDDDPTFPTYPPFKTGFFDENALFSGNFKAATSESSSATPPSVTPDPLALETNTPSPLGSIHYVELGERWVFICGEEGIRVFSREGNNRDGKPRFSPGQMVLRIPSDKIQYSRWSARLGEESFRPHWGSELVRQEVVWDDEMAEKQEEDVNVGEVPPPFGRRQSRNAWTASDEETVVVKRRRRMYDEFIAVHVSPDQKHVAALLSSSRLVFVPNFERLIDGETSLWDVGLDVQLGSVKAMSVYLSYGVGESGSGGSAGRIGVVTQRGIFIVTPYFRSGSKVASNWAHPEREVDIVVLRLAPSFMTPSLLANISCLQISDTGMWVNWTAPERKPEPPAKSTFPVWKEPQYRPYGMDDDDDDDEEEDDDMDDEDNDEIVLDDDDDNWEDEDDDNEREDDERLETFDRGAYTEPAGESRWVVNPSYPMVAMKVKEGDPVWDDYVPATFNGKGKQPETSPIRPSSPQKPRSWTTQRFPLDSTPPSQFLVEGGPCKWNAADVGSSRRFQPLERESILEDIEFVLSLKERRIRGMHGGDGVQMLPNGDILIETDNVAEEGGRPTQYTRSEVHQIRFVP